MITIFLDMDGVLANFHKEYASFAQEHMNDRKKFRQAVLEHKIFERLEKMPNADLLLNRVAGLDSRHFKIEILTSKGTFDPFQGDEAKRQKLVWLKKHGLPYNANFTRNKEEKANFATPDSILIDDSIGCIEPFVAAGGIGILHSDADISSTLNSLNSYILQLMAKNVQV
jgi:hypothetical protein